MSDRLSVRGLRVRHGGRVVLVVEALSALAGSLVVVAGAGGSGKTALAAALAGAAEADGELRVDGRLLSGPPSRRRRAGLAAAVRDDRRITGCTVAEALFLAARRTRRIDDAYARFPQLAGRRSVRGEVLSGGEQQLLQIACAWGAEPRVLVLDSPTVGLADDAANAVAALARDEVARGCAVLWLESDARAAPEPAQYALVSGGLQSAAEFATAPG